MKCTEKDCKNNAEFIVGGNSVCQEHKEGTNNHVGTAGDRLAGNL